MQRLHSLASSSFSFCQHPFTYHSHSYTFFHGLPHHPYSALSLPCRYIIIHTLLAVKEGMQDSPGAGYSSFHLFGYDFMVTDFFQVR